MESKNIELYSEVVDSAVVRLPERRILGSVIQGDTLFLLHSDLMDVLEDHKHDPDSELFYKVFQIAQGIESRLAHYIKVCDEHQVELSFELEFSVEDYIDLVR